MPVRVTVFRGLSPTILRERLLHEYRDAAGARIGAALWIGPSPEAVTDARLRLLAPGSEGAILGSPMFDWEGLALHVVRRLDPSSRLVAPGQRRLFLQQIVS